MTIQQGRVVVVTGAGGGIGSRIVDRFLVNGELVIGLDKAEISLKELAELVQDWASPAGSELIQLLVGSAPMMQPAS